MRGKGENQLNFGIPQRKDPSGQEKPGFLLFYRNRFGP